MIVSRDVFNKLISVYIEKKSIGIDTEIEVRFKSYTPNRTGYDSNTFKRILDNLLKTKKVTPVSTLVEYDGNIRKETCNDSMRTVSWVEKRELVKFFNDDYNIKFSTSIDREIKEPEMFNPTFVRERKRWSFPMMSKKFILDLTEVTENNEKRFEIELEVLDKINLKHEMFHMMVINMLRLINQTHDIYTVKEKEKIANLYNEILGFHVKKPSTFNHQTLVKPRNLKFEDVRYGGLVGNNKTTYNITYKADGERYQLLFHSSGIYLIKPPEELNLVTRIEMNYYSGMILDGELISEEDRIGDIKTKYWYLIFDCMSAPSSTFDKGETYVQNLMHPERMKYAQAAVTYAQGVKNIERSLITMTTKEFKQFRSVTDFYNVINDMYNRTFLVPYKMDGYIFTPVEGVYNPRTDKVKNFKDRTLLNFPDICKLKPPELLTTDFLIKDKQAFVLGDEGKLILFEGSDTNPISQTVNFNWDHELLYDAENLVIEFAWKTFHTEKALYIENQTRGHYTPLRIRTDKNLPNKLFVALDNLQQMFTGVQIETLLGNNTKLMSKYHNRIKRKLFDEAWEQVSLATGKKNINLLDLGSGAGGDISKWNKYSKIIASDPSKENLEEFRRRASGSTNITIVQTGAEDTKNITSMVSTLFEDKADVISSMLSMSFLWKTKETVESFANTIKQNLGEKGVFIFLTINGDIINQVKTPSLGLGPDLGNDIEMGKIKLHFDDERQYTVTIPDSIVGTQTEWKVFLDDLVELLKPEIVLEKNIICDEELFLSVGESAYTSLFSYGLFRRL